MGLGIVAIVYVIVLIAELPDKTMFASLVLGTRFPARWVFLGVAAAFAVHVVIAVTAGSLLALAPRRAVDAISAALFLVGAVILLRSAGAEEDDEPDDQPVGARSALAVGLTSFGVVFLGEWGDITQLATANLAAKYHNPLAVGVGALLGLWTAAALAISAGQALLRRISITVLHRVGAVIFVGFAIWSIIEAVR